MKLNKRCIKYSMVLIPYFELFTFSMLEERGIAVALFSFLGILFSLSRTLISTYYIFNQVFFKGSIRKQHNYLWAAVLVFGMSLIISSSFNKSIYLSYLLGVYNYIGFAAACSSILYKDELLFMKSGAVIFGILSLMGSFSIFLFPNGFFNASSKAGAVYLLGSKNSSFYYYIMFIMFYLYLKIKGLDYKHYKIKFIDKKYDFFLIYLIIFIGSALICKSSNTLICLLIVLVYYIFFFYRYKIQKLMNPYIVFCFIGIVFYFLLFNKDNNILEPLLEFFGRTSSYSGRDDIWEQAIEIIKEHWLAGNGIGSEFYLPSGVYTTHAHNWYLDIITKYGIIPLILFAFYLICHMVNLWGNHQYKINSFIVLIISILLIHSMFDDISLYIFIIVFVVMEYQERSKAADRYKLLAY